jgi:hypothetical protein
LWLFRRLRLRFLESLRLRFGAPRFFRALWLDALRRDGLRRDGFGRGWCEPLRSGDMRRGRCLRNWRRNGARGLWHWLRGLRRLCGLHWQHRLRCLCGRLRNLDACFGRGLNRRRFGYRSVVGRHVGCRDVGCVRRLGRRIVGRFGTPESFEKAEHVLAY